VLVPLLFSAPPAWVPVLVAVGALLRRSPEFLSGAVHPARAVVELPNAWHAAGPALVLALAGADGADLSDWPLYVAALAAQALFDTVSGVLRESAALGVAPALQARILVWVLAVDVALSPVGLLAAVLMDGEPAAGLALLPLAALFGVFARERDERIRHALQLSGAYRGTALVMADVLRADDAYTGGIHSQGVLALALDVGAQLALDSRRRRDLEFASLLHDIGKIHVPNEILNKPGKLTEEEWELVRRHPEDGQRMLERVGGVFSDVAPIVRAHHERIDGRGYPDGLTGEDIPLEARIISACDAYSAMTTDRPYRAAMPIEDAVEELLRGGGSQFDERVVEALLRVARGDGPA
jgi:HD-GYP domain-containing protein (c-di-GMP phosphodiesterase class II)